MGLVVKQSGSSDNRLEGFFDVTEQERTLMLNALLQVCSGSPVFIDAAICVANN